MALPQIKRDLVNFVRDEKGTMTKKNVLKASLALGTLVGLSHTAFAYHSDVASKHGNILTLNYNDPEGVGQHSHHASHNNADLPDGDGGGGWLFDCLGTKDNLAINNIGEFFTWINGEHTHWTLKAYHLAGVLFRVTRINGIEINSHLWTLRKWITPRRTLSADKKSPLLYALAIHGFEAAQKGATHLATTGHMELLLNDFLAHCEYPLESDVKKINWMIAALESAGTDTQWIVHHPKFVALKALTEYISVCTSAKLHLGTPHPHASVPSKSELSHHELRWYYALIPLGLMIRIFYKIGLRRSITCHPLWKNTQTSTQRKFVLHAKPVKKLFLHNI